MTKQELVFDPVRLNASGILRKWHTKDFDSFTNDLDAKTMVEAYLKAFTLPDNGGLGLYLYGANGTGKTLLATLILRSLMYKRVRVKMIATPDLVTLHAEKWSNYDAKEFYIGIQSVTVLLIDDIGKEKRKVGGDDLALNAIDNILRYRTQALLPTLFTSNLSPDKVSSFYSEDVASLMREACLPVHVGGEDYRREIGKTIASRFES